MGERITRIRYHTAAGSGSRGNLPMRREVVLDAARAEDDSQVCSLVYRQERDVHIPYL